MTDDQTWTVVQFIDDKTVEAVPSIWIQGDNCHWPTLSQQKLLGAIRKCEPLNTCWPCHKVRIFRKATFSDYTKARAKARLAEDTSDLNSGYETESQLLAKRRRIPKVMSSSDDSGDNEDQLLPIPPKFKKAKQILVDSSYDLNESVNSTFNSTLSSNITSLNINNSGTENHIDQNLHNIEIDVPVITDIRQCSGCVDTEKQLETTLNQIHLLRTIMTDTLQEVREIKKNMKDNTITPLEKNFFTKFPLIKFPLNSEEEVKILEATLANKVEYENGVSELANLGGNNNYNFVKRALSSLITNDIAMQYSWLGRKTKKDFHRLQIAKLVIRSAEVAKIASSQNETEISIQAWLRRASDRKKVKKTQ